MIRAVFFDFYGTLATWAPAAAEIQRDAAKAEGVPVDTIKVTRAYPAANAMLDRENAAIPLASRSTAERDTFFTSYEQLLLSTAGVTVDRALAARIWQRVRAAPKELALYPGALETLAQLRERDLIVGVISNMGRELDAHVAQLGLADHASVWVSSAEAGVAKPHLGIFTLALTKAGVEAREALHVGDGYESDVLGAQAAGMHALLLLHDGAPAPEGVAAARGLSEVVPRVLELSR